MIFVFLNVQKYEKVGEYSVVFSNICLDSDKKAELLQKTAN